MDDHQISKTQKKREVEELQQIGEQLVDLTPDQLKNMNLPEDLTRAVTDARQISRHGAKRRQMQYIGRLMREVDTSPIVASLQNIRQGDRRKAILFKQIEHWREELKKGKTEIIEEILESCPAAERQRLYQLSRNARDMEENTKQARKASKAIFQYLRKICE
jgi:ribosome-associated protein